LNDTGSGGQFAQEKLRSTIFDFATRNGTFWQRSDDRSISRKKDVFRLILEKTPTYLSDFRDMKLPCIKTRFFEKTVCLFVKRIRFEIDDFGILSLARRTPTPQTPHSSK
jgi:hypothetical protein